MHSMHSVAFNVLKLLDNSVGQCERVSLRVTTKWIFWQIALHYKHAYTYTYTSIYTYSEVCSENYDQLWIIDDENEPMHPYELASLCPMFNVVVFFVSSDTLRYIKHEQSCSLKIQTDSSSLNCGRMWCRKQLKSKGTYRTRVWSSRSGPL